MLKPFLIDLFKNQSLNLGLVRITREGLRLILATLLIGLASLNTGNNLMYLIFSVMLSVLCLSLILTFVNLKGVEISVKPEEELFKRRPAKIKIVITNKKRFLASHSIVVTSRRESPFRLSCYIDRISPGDTIEVYEEILPLRRGIVNLKEELLLWTGFPFIFTERSVKPLIDKTLLIYPEIKDLELPLPFYASGSRRSTNEGDFQKVRPYQYGDDRRLVHWKATAKTGELMIKELGNEEIRKVTIFFDNFIPADAAISPLSMDSFEESVSLAASLSERFISTDYYLRFVTCTKGGEVTVTIPFGRGRDHLLKILDHLAIVSPVTVTSPLSQNPLCLVDETDLSELGGEVTVGASVLILQSELSPFSKFRDRAEMIFYATAI